MEVLFAMVAMLVVTGALMTMLERTLRAEPRITNRSTRIREARSTLEKMTRELRQAYSVRSATTSTIDFLTYTRSGGASAAVGKRVQYDCSTGGTCYRAEGLAPAGALGSNVKLVDGLSNADVFTYVPDATTPENVKIKLNFTVGGQTHVVNLNDGVNLRNDTNFDD